MTADDRKTLEAVASEYDEAAGIYAAQLQRADECRRSAAAIRAALARIDALEAENADLRGHYAEALATCDGMQSMLTQADREVGNLRARFAAKEQP